MTLFVSVLGTSLIVMSLSITVALMTSMFYEVLYK